MSATNDALTGLKDFQRTTVAYVHKRLYEDRPPARRFLLADEVGLGKTLVARGLIALIAQHPSRARKRSDIVYICSNAEIARQNIGNLRLSEKTHTWPSRITLLALHLHELKRGVNLISFTPKTSFERGHRPGKAEERALLYWLLHGHWWKGDDALGPRLVLTANAPWGFEEARQGLRYARIHAGLARRFIRTLARRERQFERASKPTLEQRFLRLARRAARRGELPRSDWDERNEIIGELRDLLAEVSVKYLRPQLVILDEFQRFRSLLEGETEASELAHALFEHAECRVLLMSATPYPMYTQNVDAGDADHYEEFVATLSFLINDDQRLERIQHRFRDLGRELRLIGTPSSADLTRLAETRRSLEGELARVMCRTERLASSPDREGMLGELNAGAGPVTSHDLQAYLATQGAARVLGDEAYVRQVATLEYWKSAPYLFNFMESYELKRGLRKAMGRPTVRSQLARALRSSGNALLDFGAVERYSAVDQGNARLRALSEQPASERLWRLLWLPPTLPYYDLAGPFADPPSALTKRLVFSSWRVVPKAGSAMLSYEVERSMVRSHDKRARNTKAGRGRLDRRPLDFLISRDRLTAMPVLALLYPSLTLAAEIDPLVLARELKGRLTRAELVKLATARMKALLDQLDVRGHGRRVDPRWYWAAPLLLDRQRFEEATDEFFDHAWWLAEGWSEGGHRDHEEPVSSRWLDHVELAQQVVNDTLERPLGRRPRALAYVLGQMALGAPGTVAMRALSRVADDPESYEARTAAGSIAWQFRSLFNGPDAAAMLRGLPTRGKGKHAGDYWRRVVDYCVDGCLQATLDEYIHLIGEALRPAARDNLDLIEKVAARVRAAVGMRTALVQADRLRRTPGPDVRLENDYRRMRVHFAVPFGQGVEQEGGGPSRDEAVRNAFNSPFWPFVLFTTSVGQEGLDFHTYCHSVVHWNLPSNPVDLEQREGRVHRYKGHAVRKNLADRFGPEALKARNENPWDRLFELGARARRNGESEIVPFWVFLGDAKIERHVPLIPMSREHDRLHVLLQGLIYYRLVLGQPRQQDTLEHLMRNLSPKDAQRWLNELRLDLTPKLATPASARARATASGSRAAKSDEPRASG